MRFIRWTALLLLAACHDRNHHSPPTYSVAGTLSGLSAPGLVLQNNGVEELTVAADAATFQFETNVAAGGTYDVTIATQPDGLTCAVTDGSGSEVHAAVTNISVTCAPLTQVIAGTITGLAADGLVLQNNGGDDLTVAIHASSFQFATQVEAGGSYDITVATQPEGLTCTVTGGAGTNVQAVVSNIRITCSAVTHTVAGTVFGLTADGLVLQNNGADDLIVAASATTFQFALPVAAGSGYSVTAMSQPTGLTCSVSNGAGTDINADITGVQITCSATALSIGGSLSGLTGSGLVLQNNGADTLTIAASATAFEFAMSVAYGAVYHVTVLTQPAGQTCSVGQGAAVATAPVTNVALTCTDIPTYTLTPSAGTHGSIAPSAPVVVNESGNQAFVATADSGYAVAEWSLDGAVVQSGGDVYTVANVTANHTLTVSFGQATLTPSVSLLALSVNDTGLNAALAGNPRHIILTNTGSVPAHNVSLTYPTWPAGTTASSTCGTTLPAGSACTITLTPGSSATSTCITGIAPTPGTVMASANDAADTAVDVVVVGYGCIYQGGYVFAVDDTTPDTGSIGGKVASLTDQAPAYPNGILWSSTGNSSDDYTAILGIDETSTSSSPSPVGPAYPPGTTPFLACTGSTDGACNTANILAYYNFNRAAGGAAPTPLNQYAAGLCAATIDSYSDWYLPAICETGVGGGACSSIASAPQNMQSNLVSSGVVPLAGYYWSSTEHSAAPSVLAWLTNFDSGGGDFHTDAGKGNPMGVRCARALTH